MEQVHPAEQLEGEHPVEHHPGELEHLEQLQEEQLVDLEELKIQEIVGQTQGSSGKNPCRVETQEELQEVHPVVDWVVEHRADLEVVESPEVAPQAELDLAAALGQGEEHLGNYRTSEIK